MNQSCYSFHTTGLLNKSFLTLVLLIGIITFSNAQECAIEELSNNFEFAFGSTSDVEIADEITVPENQNFILEKFTFNLWLLDTATIDLDLVSIRFYEHAGTFPAARFDEALLAPSKDTIVGVRTFGTDVYNVHQITLELDTPVEFTGQTDAPTIFWIGIFTPDPPSFAAYESTNESSSQILTSFFLNGTWRNSYANGTQFLDKACVFKAEGQCVPIVSSSKNINLNSRISIFPNPTNGIVNLDIPSDIGVDNVSLFDYLGNNIGTSLNNEYFDLSSLPNGIYLAQIETDKGTLLKRILKK